MQEILANLMAGSTSIAKGGAKVEEGYIEEGGEYGTEREAGRALREKAEKKKKMRISRWGFQGRGRREGGKKEVC